MWRPLGSEYQPPPSKLEQSLRESIVGKTGSDSEPSSAQDRARQHMRRNVVELSLRVFRIDGTHEEVLGRPSVHLRTGPPLGRPIAALFTSESLKVKLSEQMTADCSGPSSQASVACVLGEYDGQSGGILVTRALPTVNPLVPTVAGSALASGASLNNAVSVLLPRTHASSNTCKTPEVTASKMFPFYIYKSNKSVFCRRLSRRGGAPKLSVDNFMGMHSMEDFPSLGSGDQRSIMDVNTSPVCEIPAAFIRHALADGWFDFRDVGVASKHQSRIATEWQLLHDDLMNHVALGCTLPVHHVCHHTPPAEGSDPHLHIGHIGHTEVWALYNLRVNEQDIAARIKTACPNLDNVSRVEFHITSVLDPCDFCSMFLSHNAHRVVGSIAGVASDRVCVRMTSLLRYSEAQMWPSLDETPEDHGVAFAGALAVGVSCVGAVAHVRVSRAAGMSRTSCELISLSSGSVSPATEVALAPARATQAAGPSGYSGSPAPVALDHEIDATVTQEAHLDASAAGAQGGV